MLLRHYTKVSDNPERWEYQWITLEEFQRRVQQRAEQSVQENSHDVEDA